MARTCTATLANGRACRARPLRDEDRCFWHSPAHQEEATEARRLGGMRRRRERTVAGAYDLDGLVSIEGSGRLLEIAVLDTLGLENSIARSRTLIMAAGVAAKLYEASELEARLAAVEAALEDPTRPERRGPDGEEPMALARRLSRVERDLDVEGSILHWLAEAHGFGSIEAYARWTTEQPDAQDPFARLLDRVEAAARKARRSDPALDIQRAVKAARRQARFTAFLVVQLNVEAAEKLVSLGLSQMALVYCLRELTLREALAEHGEAVAELADAEGLDRSMGSLA